ncbi:MFS transporter [Taklimakanibacter lacteus]|uniref:MFS transporter n=1 Tax=Taklimakanibacter lacteus TaxID=2268456 RepID=UPI000E66D020
MRPLHLIVASVTGAGFGINAVKYAVPALLALGGSAPSAIGMFAASVAAAWPAFGLLAGLILDRSRKVQVLRAGEALAVAGIMVLLALYATGTHALVLLCLAGFAVGASEVLVDTSSQSILPEVVAKQDLRSANSLLNGAKTVGVTLLAPVLVTALVDVAPIAALAAAAVILLAGLLLIAGVAGAAAPAQAGLRFADVTSGLRLLIQAPVLRGLTIVLAVMSIAWGGWFVLIVSYVISAEGLALSATAYGFIVTTLGCGSLAGAFAYGRVHRVIGTRLVLAADVVGTILFHAIPALGFGYVSTAVAAFLAGFGGVFWVISVSAYQQAAVPVSMLGRVVASYRWIGWSAFFAGSLIAGPLADRWGFAGAFASFAVLNLVLLIAFPIVIPKSEVLDEPLAA